MKTYEKPKLLALSLSGNNMLFWTCTFDVIGDNNQLPGFPEMVQEMIGKPISEQCFAADENCAVPVAIDGYCKFTGAESGDQVVINS